MESRIGQLDLRIRAPARHAPGLIPAARGFASRVLQRCDELLEQRAPGRLVFMRHLDMRWRLWEDGIEAAGEVEAVASELAVALDEAARSASSSPDGTDEIAVFADEVHYCAEYLRAVAEDRLASCWFFEPMVGDTLPPALVGGTGRGFSIEQVVARLAARGMIERVLSLLPPPLVDFSQALDDANPPLAAQQILALLRSRRTPSTGLSDRTETDDGLRSVADAGVPATSEGMARDTVDTQFGGAFYLLTSIAELSVGETLWRACLPESAVFTRVAAAILGVDASGDPAPRLIGGSGSGAELTTVTVDQHAEVATGTLTALTHTLSRHHPELPTVRLFVATHHAGRLLVAAAAASPFVVFAWPADSADAVHEGLAIFLAHWPASAPTPLAQPALASVDRSGRIKTARPAGPAPLIPDHDNLLATTLLAQAAGSIAFLFAARVGATDVSAPAHLVQRFLSVPARVGLWDDEMIVSMPVERIDLVVRRAGLDRDPRWVPWLNRRVRFEFNP